jgi:hypothetical protein
MSEFLNKDNLDLMTMPGPRLPELEEWLIKEVWTRDRFQGCKSSPSQYLKSGEALVSDREILLSAAADSYFGELTGASFPSRTVADFFSEYGKGNAVVLDGCSLRELPRLQELARISGRPIIESACSRSAIPSTTEDFIGRRLNLGLPVTSPSKLVSRREFKERAMGYHFFQRPNESQTLSDKSVPVLLWHRFPDLRFTDSTASGADFYDGIWDTLDLVWQRTVQILPATQYVLVTSDHGYIFLGPGLSDRSLDGKDRSLKGKRFRWFAEDEPLPGDSPELYIDRQRRLAVIKGRCHNRPQAPSPSQSLFRHGGLSLMEVLTPWLVLGPVES